MRKRGCKAVVSFTKVHVEALQHPGKEKNIAKDTGEEFLITYFHKQNLSRTKEVTVVAFLF